MQLTRVYVAGPLTTGDVFANIRRAVAVGQQLIELGYAPYVPHLTAFWELIHPNDYEAWLTQDLQWLSCCEILVRLEGVSSGADREVAEARKLGIRIVYLSEQRFEDPVWATKYIRAMMEEP